MWYWTWTRVVIPESLWDHTYLRIFLKWKIANEMLGSSMQTSPLTLEVSYFTASPPAPQTVWVTWILSIRSEALWEDRGWTQLLLPRNAFPFAFVTGSPFWLWLPLGWHPPSAGCLLCCSLTHPLYRWSGLGFDLSYTLLLPTTDNQSPCLFG